MRQYFQLDAKEKKQEWLMLIFAILALLTIAKGLYNQYHNIDQDHILIPLLLIMFGLYFFVYSINGLTKGNLIPKWTPFYLFQIMIFFTKKIGSNTRDKARILSIKLLGIFGLIISVGLFILTTIVLTKYK